MKIARFLSVLFSCLMLFSSVASADKGNNSGKMDVNLENINHSMNALGSVNLVLGTSNSVVYTSLFAKNNAFPLIALYITPGISLYNSLQTTIAAPIAIHKLKNHNLYRNTAQLKRLDNLSKVFLGLSIGNGVLSATNPLYVWYSENPAEYSSGYSLQLYWAISNTVWTSMTMFLLAKEAKIMNNMQKGQVTDNISDSKKTVAFVPAVSPYIDRNFKISGATAGLGVTF